MLLKKGLKSIVLELYVSKCKLLIYNAKHYT